jgi:hypothetical protein
MNKQSLFDEEDYYTVAALQIDREAKKLLKPYIEKYSGLYSIREISFIIQRTLYDLECELILKDHKEHQ